jgi:thiol:disulfide interchange protein DsbG
MPRAILATVEAKPFVLRMSTNRFTKGTFMKLASFPLIALFLLVAPLAWAAHEKEAVVPLASSAPTNAEAPAAHSAKVPDVSNVMFIQNLRKIGATVYYLGQDLGVDGWFVVKDGQVQIMYTTPDQKAVMVGALLSAEGANISQQQVMLLANNNPDIQKIIKGSAAVTGQAPKPAQPVLPPIQTTAQTPAQPSASAAASTASPEVITPSQKFFNALLKAPSVTFGNESAPQLIMIMDVNCPHCHKTWQMAQPLVDAGKLRVTMVPIGALGPESEAQAANWLSNKDPHEAWKKHVAGDEAIFKTETPPADKVAAIHSNTVLVEKWGVDQTPYSLYHSKNGKVRLIIGEPKNMDEILIDIK